MRQEEVEVEKAKQAEEQEEDVEKMWNRGKSNNRVGERGKGGVDEGEHTAGERRRWKWTNWSQE